jgi:catechol 2,3-dioxygenase-like lactoylglutathione lyase family enzyme
MADMKLELVPIPVEDIDQTRTFYVDGLGFDVDVDREVAPGVHIVQVTPPGSACSVMFGRGLPVFSQAPPGSVHGLHLVVDDIDRARDELIGRGVPVQPIQDTGAGVKYAELTDPSGNTLLLQEMAWRTGDAF